MPSRPCAPVSGSMRSLKRISSPVLRSICSGATGLPDVMSRIASLPAIFALPLKGVVLWLSSHLSPICDAATAVNAKLVSSCLLRLKPRRSTTVGMAVKMLTESNHAYTPAASVVLGSENVNVTPPVTVSFGVHVN